MSQQRYITKNIRILSEEMTKPNSPTRTNGQILIRLEHRCGPGSLFIDCDAEIFDFGSYLEKNIKKVTEMNLLGNYPIDHRHRLIFNTPQGRTMSHYDIMHD